MGLSNGTLNVFDACDPTSVPHFNVMTGDWPIQACVCVLDELWVACGASLYRLDPTSNTLKVNPNCQARKSCPSDALL